MTEKKVGRTNVPFPSPRLGSADSEPPRLKSRADRPITTQTGINVTKLHGSDLVKILLGPFAQDSIEDRFGPHLSRGIQSALRHYARRVRSARRPPVVPLFMREEEIDRATATELEVAVPYEVQSALEREARAQGLPLERIVTHALFVYLSDVDTAGRTESPPVPQDFEAGARYTVHADRSLPLPPPRRSRDSARTGGTLRRRGRSGGRSRFGRR
jgi:hypothetical protein